ncbi:nuclear transport factor 2 family protein [Promicromonospora sp. NPDC090134]|uniref:nuclear transport factor 2 family protein n=1 Tax=Promicromonospora sp. NPDC090134 TaxID=3364408 RepID=UPI00380FE417
MSENITRQDDRVAIRELIDAWAHHADRRLPDRQAALFTPDGTVTVHMDGQVAGEPAQRLQGRAELAESFRVLDAYESTTHLNGQSVLTFDPDDPDAATGESYCLAHHVWTEDGQRTLMVMAIRYLDTFIRSESGWLFADRRLVVDWTDKRTSANV